VIRGRLSAEERANARRALLFLVERSAPAQLNDRSVAWLQQLRSISPSGQLGTLHGQIEPNQAHVEQVLAFEDP
jgi:mRNA-degrading endonuclease toxin of MazEF toxin-antitoxin module